jgi:UDP-GlcNAc:undecaprenyl-phosphate/decaprenyl-phosphate GlcNAc-1-phosphate transferase
MDDIQGLALALPLAIAFFAALALTPLAGRLATRIGAIDRPSARGVNQRPGMPLLGGLAVAAAFFAAMIAVDQVQRAEAADAARWLGLAAGGLLLVATGIWDDRYGMNAAPKLTMQLIAASIAIASGFEISRFSNPLTTEVVELPRWIVWPASLLWIVGVTNALNLLDGLDGLAAGVGVIIGATLTAIAWQAGQPFAVFLGLALVGALLGFLPHNFAPARIFLGDTGSLFIGYALALLALEGYRRVSLITFLAPLLALAVPILDTGLSILRRMRSHAPIFSADRLHMHHRLLEAEGSARAAVLQFYVVTAAFCLIALSFTRLHGISAVVFLAAVALLTLRLLRNLGALDLGARKRESDG